MITKWLGVVFCSILIIPLAGFAADIPGNLAPNPSFEIPENGAGQLPAGWNPFSSKQLKAALTDKVAATGKQSLMLNPQGVTWGAGGIWLPLPVEEGAKYTFEAKYIADKEDRPSGTIDLRLVIEWKREDGSEISRINQPVKAHQISRLRWETLSLRKVQPPKGAAKGVFGIHVCDNERSGSGTVYVDDVVILRQ